MVLAEARGGLGDGFPRDVGAAIHHAARARVALAPYFHIAHRTIFPTSVSREMWSSKYEFRGERSTATFWHDVEARALDDGTTAKRTEHEWRAPLPSNAACPTDGCRSPCLSTCAGSYTGISGLRATTPAIR